MTVPAVPQLPEPVRRARRGASANETFTVELETVTPILGGAPATRQVDTVDIIRVPTIRGHLRFWWRALYGTGFATSAELFAAEAALWGRAADEKGGRSAVEIQAEIQRRSRLDEADPPIASPSGYALWPARATREQPTARRHRPGIRFRLTVQAPPGEIDPVKNAMRAWILFGGYGSRTRRGVGSLLVVGNSQERRTWLPCVEDPEDLEPEAVRAEFAYDPRAALGAQCF
jgi:CRISPR-associated protein Cmr1